MEQTTSPILKTKLFVPRGRPGQILRAPLIEALNRGVLYPLTLVCAGAGFGKTTLLAGWAQQATARAYIPVAWVSLDALDNELYRFFSYLIGALRSVHQGIGAQTLELLRGLQPLPLDTALVPLINDLDAAPGNVALVLDDYQFITNPSIHEALLFLIEHLPANVHLVIATRADPPLPLHRLRARGQLVEVRTDDLRFTFEEVTQFLNEVMALDLDKAELEKLDERTEGWAAGLQMAALSLSGRKDRGLFIDAFSGSNRYILDYLAEEVLNRQPPEVQHFLLRTSVLERLCAPLCAALLVDEDAGGEGNASHISPAKERAVVGSQEILERLEAANLFVVPLDDQRHWYRYHHLFADLLQARLRQLSPPVLPVLHSRAAEWYENEGLLSEALTHASQAKDYARMARIFETHGQGLMDRSELGALAWLLILPDEVVEGSAWLCILKSWLLLVRTQATEVEWLVSRAEELLARERDPERTCSALGLVRTLRAYMAWLRGEDSQAVGFAGEALTLLPAGQAGGRGLANYVLGSAYFMVGKLDEAAHAYSVSLERDKAGLSTFGIATTAARLARLRIIEGRLHDAETISLDNLGFIESHGRERFFASAYPYLSLAELHYERNDLRTTLAQAREGIQENRRWGIANCYAYGYSLLVRALVAQGDVDAAARAMREGDALIEASPSRVSPDYEAELRACRVQLCLAAGEPEAAARWARSSGLGPDDPLLFKTELDHLSLARVLMWQGDHTNAGRLLRRLAEAAERVGRNGRLVQISVLLTCCLRALGDTSGAVEALEKSLSLARPENYMRTYLDEGLPIAAMLRLYLGHRAQFAHRELDGNTGERAPALTEYAGLLLAQFPAPPQTTHGESGVDHEQVGGKVRGRAAASVDGLTPRELQVLSLIDQGLSNQEIADRLIVVVGTVKAQVHSICGKLDARNRVEALAHAREHGLL